MMFRSSISRRVLSTVVLALSLQMIALRAGDSDKLPDPKVLTFRLPQDIKWENKTSGSQEIVLFGDPNQAGSEYGVLHKWFPHSMSRPHFHQNDRYIYVISGTWWVGSGPKYDPDSTYPMPAGSFVHHIANQIHYDGAKDAECLILITGIGPVKSTAAEQK